jgi:hypothetical protein
MDLTVDQFALSRALRLITRVAPAKPALPILQMVLLQADFGRLKLTATDGAIGAIAEVPATIEEAGQTAVLAGLLGTMSLSSRLVRFDCGWTPSASGSRRAAERPSLSCLPLTRRISPADPPWPRERPSSWTPVGCDWP